MLFNSAGFLFAFLPIFLIVYFLSGKSFRNVTLTCFSYLFYGWWDWRFTLLILVSTIVDYYCGQGIHESETPSTRKRLLFASVAMNLSLLGFFKYFMFLNKSVSVGFSWVGMSYPQELLALRIILPVGISFYTFQSMSYTIDIYRGLVRPTRRFIDFACYISMFPQLVAGPIVRYANLEHQLDRPVFSSCKFYLGIQYFILGLSKKVLIADSASVLADGLFDAVDQGGFSSADVLLGVVAYSVQIYFDFSGYSDMAIGLGHLCGFTFPVNFDSPYKSRSTSEFWKRWHISLSTWLRDYLYIPLGGSRNGPFITYRNLTLTMLLGGLWHGASWNFVIWGGYHGTLLAVERMLGNKNPLRKLPSVLRLAVTFSLISVGWIFFRSSDLEASLGILSRLVAFEFDRLALLGVLGHRTGLAATFLGLLLALMTKNSNQIHATPSAAKTLALSFLLVLSVAFLFGAVSHPFLYFQF